MAVEVVVEVFAVEAAVEVTVEVAVEVAAVEVAVEVFAFGVAVEVAVEVFVVEITVEIVAVEVVVVVYFAVEVTAVEVFAVEVAVEVNVCRGQCWGKSLFIAEVLHSVSGKRKNHEKQHLVYIWLVCIECLRMWSFLSCPCEQLSQL